MIYATFKTHPVTGKQKNCLVYENHYGVGKHAFKFEGEKVYYSQEELESLQPMKSYADN